MIISGSNLTDVAAPLELLNTSVFPALTKGPVWQISRLQVEEEAFTFDKANLTH